MSKYRIRILDNISVDNTIYKGINMYYSEYDVLILSPLCSKCICISLCICFFSLLYFYNIYTLCYIINIYLFSFCLISL